MTRISTAIRVSAVVAFAVILALATSVDADCAIANCETCNAANVNVCDKCTTGYIQTNANQTCSPPSSSSGVPATSRPVVSTTRAPTITIPTTTTTTTTKKPTGPAYGADCKVTFCSTCTFEEPGKCLACYAPYILGPGNASCKRYLNDPNSASTGAPAVCIAVLAAVIATVAAATTP